MHFTGAQEYITGAGVCVKGYAGVWKEVGAMLKVGGRETMHKLHKLHKSSGYLGVGSVVGIWKEAIWHGHALWPGVSMGIYRGGAIGWGEPQA